MNVVPIRTYGDVQYDRFSNMLRLEKLQPHVSLKFKAIFPRVPKTQTGRFDITASPDICNDLLWFMERYPLKLGRGVEAALLQGKDAFEVQRANVERILSPDWKPTGAVAAFREGLQPYPYQASAAELASTLGALLLLDDIGLGKTISALATLCRSGQLPAAVIVQAHLADQWAEYVEEFTTLKAHVIKGREPYDVPEADLYIFRYSNIGGWADYVRNKPFPAVVFDEIQELRRGKKSESVPVLKGIAAEAFVADATLRMGLTATPIYNYGDEIFNVVEFISPGALGTRAEFLVEWCEYNGGHWVVTDPDALGAYLRDVNLTLRRTEEEVDKQLPPVNVLMHHIDFDADAVKADEAEARILAQRVLEGSFAEAGQAARALDMRLRMATGVAKAKGVAALVRMLVTAGEKVLLGGWHRDVYRIWLEELADLNPVMYTGTESAAAKRKAKQAFLGDSNILIMSLRSGAGLDGLQQVCSKVVFGEFDWSPQVHKQFYGRLRRPGQKNQVDAIFAHTNGGSDPALVETLGLKSSQAQGITDPFKGAQAVHSDDSRIKKLAAAYLAREAEAGRISKSVLERVARKKDK